MSFSRWQKLSERMTAKVVLLADAVDADVVDADVVDAGGAAAGAVLAAKVLSLIFTE
jgi:hypothetical protein